MTGDTNNAIIEGTNKLIATVGIKKLIIIDTEDALLVCEKDSAGSIKKMLEDLNIYNRTRYY